jgi:circadian clock protein KaiC
MNVELKAGALPTLRKAPTGIAGLDEILKGGLPAGRPTLVCGGPGCGKTTLAMEFLVRGALEFGEPGLFVSFEETSEQLIENSRSLGFDVNHLIETKQLKISYVAIAREEITENGVFTLDALLIRLNHGIAEVGAKRVVLDTMEAIFSALSPGDLLRNEIARLFHWLRAKGVSAIVTGERGKNELTRHGFEEYISDCVLLLDHRIASQISRRNLRIVKYRGSSHESDEFPFLIGDTGFSVFPITSLNLDHVALSERVGTGVNDLDEMLEGQGYFKATAVLVSGRSGTGKSSLAAAFVLAACRRGERCLYFAFEESSLQIIRNMQSVGIDLSPWVEKGLLTIRSFRPSYRGLEEHLVSVADEANRIKPACVVMDPITDFVAGGGVDEVKSMLTRILDLLKRRGSTLFMTALTASARLLEGTELHVSSLVDTWIALNVERTTLTSRRTLYVVKSRGMMHSQDTREFLMSTHGLSLRSVSPSDERTAVQP